MGTKRFNHQPVTPRSAQPVEARPAYHNKYPHCILAVSEMVSSSGMVSHLCKIKDSIALDFPRFIGTTTHMTMMISHHASGGMATSIIAG